MSSTTGNAKERAELEALMRLGNLLAERDVILESAVRIPTVQHLALGQRYEREGSRLVRRLASRVYAMMAPT